MKRLTDYRDLRQFLTDVYSPDDLKIFSEDCEAFMGDYNSMNFCIDVYTAFTEEIEQHWKDWDFDPDPDSFYSTKAQKLMSAVQSMAEKIVYETRGNLKNESETPDCGGEE